MASKLTSATATGVAALSAAAVVGSAATPPVALAATTALVVGASGLPDPTTSPAYMSGAETYYFPFTYCRTPSCQVVPVVTPEQLFPLIGTMTLNQSLALGAPLVDAAVQDQLAADPTGRLLIFGGSQGAILAGQEKKKLAGEATAPATDQVEFVLAANESRPNGGILTRFPVGFTIPGLGVSAVAPSPTNTGYKTLDVNFEYDGMSDFPLYPLNVLADVNALLGLVYLHGSELGNTSLLPTTRTGPGGYTVEQFEQLLNDPANAQTYGDTTYITIPTKALPILQPLRDLGVFTKTTALTTPLADLIEPTLRVLIDLGYNRNIPFGQPTTFQLAPLTNPVTLATDLLNAAAQGVRQAIADVRSANKLPTSTPLANTTSPATTAAGSKTVTDAVKVASRSATAATSSVTPAPASSSETVAAPVTRISNARHAAVAADASSSAVTPATTTKTPRTAGRVTSTDASAAPPTSQKSSERATGTPSRLIQVNGASASLTRGEGAAARGTHRSSSGKH